MLDVCAAAAAAATVSLTSPPPVMTDRRAAAADSMALSRRRHFRDVYIFEYNFLEFFKAVDNFNIYCKHPQIMKMSRNETTCLYIN